MTKLSRRRVIRGLGLASLGVVATTQNSRTAMAVSNWDDTRLTYSSSDGSLPSLQLSSSDLSFDFAYSNFPSGPTTVDVRLDARSPSHNYEPLFTGSFTTDKEDNTQSIDGSTLNSGAFPVDLLGHTSISQSDFTAESGKTKTTSVDFRVVFSAAGETTTVETTCTVELTNTSTVTPSSVVDDFDSYSDGQSLSSPWQTNGSPVVDTSRSYSGSKSLHSNNFTQEGGSYLIYSDLQGGTPSTIQFRYNESTNNHGGTWLVKNPSGQNICASGTGNPGVYVIDGNGNHDLVYYTNVTPAYDEWREIILEFDWENETFDVTWNDLTGNTTSASMSNLPFANSSSGIGKMGLASDAFGYDQLGPADDIWIDDASRVEDSS